MDLTDFSGVADTPQIPKVAPTNNPAPQENLQVPDNPEAREFRKRHWTIDAGINSGQVKAGEMDNEQAEFLKNTEMVKEGEPAKGVNE